MPVWAQALLRLAVALLASLRQRRARKRVAAVRADPAGQWLRKFGGADRRAASGSDNAGGGDN